MKVPEEALENANVVLNVNKKTCESKIHAGLFFAGEVLDIDGDTGGYNLQAAFSTAYLAAQRMKTLCA